MLKIIVYKLILLFKMKCSKCGFENKDNAKFCTKCGGKLIEETNPPAVNQSSNNSKIIMALLVVIIIILVAVVASFVVNNNSGPTSTNDASNKSIKTSQEDKVDEGNGQNTQSVESSKSKTKSWQSIGSYSGSGSGTQKIEVPSGRIMVKLSAFPIKNYADNHLYVTGSSGTGGVDWGPTSDVETRSDSFECTLSSSETFTINYYETVSWEVEFFRYQ